MNPLRSFLDPEQVLYVLRGILGGVRAEFVRLTSGIRRLFRNERTGPDGVMWEPLVLLSFLLAAALIGPSSPVSTMFGHVEEGALEQAVVGLVLSGPALLEVSPPTVVVPDLPAVAKAEGRDEAERRHERALVPREAARVASTGTDRALIRWWNEERWRDRDAEAAEWRREWLRVARRDPERVPLELWLSVLEWAPNDRDLLRSASRAAERYTSRRRRGGWMSSSTDGRAPSDAVAIAADIERAVRDAQRRNEYGAHRDDAPDSSWYRSLLRRLRGGP